MLKAIIAISALSMTLAIALTTPSFAADARQAIRLCDKNPNCNYDVQSNGDVLIYVGDDIIDCPQEGQCICSCTHRQRKGVKLNGPGPVAAILGNRD